MPPRSEVHTVIPPLVIRTPQPKLPVSPTVLDVAAPKIEENFRYGDPVSPLIPLSAGTGSAGIGSGQLASHASGTDPGSGPKQSASAGAVFSLNQVSVAPLLLYKVDPDYSEQARLARYNGTVLLRLVIDEKGDPRDIRVLRSLGLGLDEKAIEAVRHWRFRPGLKDGKAVAVDANIEVSFRLL
jgi:TonB family protein